MRARVHVSDASGGRSTWSLERMTAPTIVALALVGFLFGVSAWSRIVLTALACLGISTKARAGGVPYSADQERKAVWTILVALVLWFTVFGIAALLLWYKSAQWAKWFFGAMMLAPIPPTVWQLALLRRASIRRSQNASL
jgi:hypothetical protein